MTLSFAIIFNAGHDSAGDIHEIVPAGRNVLHVFRNLVATGHHVRGLKVHGEAAKKLPGVLSIGVYKSDKGWPEYRIHWDLEGERELMFDGIALDRVLPTFEANYNDLVRLHSIAD